MSNIGRLTPANCTGAAASCTKGFASSELGTRFMPVARFIANNATPTATARPIPTPHPGQPLPWEAVRATGSACSSLFVALQLEPVFFVVTNCACTASSFCRRAFATGFLLFLGSFAFTVVCTVSGCSCSSERPSLSLAFVSIDGVLSLSSTVCSANFQSQCLAVVSEAMFRSFEMSADLRAKLLLPFLSVKAKSLISRLNAEELEDYEGVRDFLLSEFKLTPKARFDNATKRPDLSVCFLC